jgi:hypothetical protein
MECFGRLDSPLVHVFRGFSLLAALIQHSRIIALPSGGFLRHANWLIDSFYDWLFAFLDKTIGTLASTNMRALSTAGAVWVLGGNVFMTLCILITSRAWTFMMSHCVMASFNVVILSGTILPVTISPWFYFGTAGALFLFVLVVGLSGVQHYAGLLLGIAVSAMTLGHVNTIDVNPIASAALLISGLQGAVWVLMTVLYGQCCPCFMPHCKYSCGNVDLEDECLAPTTTNKDHSLLSVLLSVFSIAAGCILIIVQLSGEIPALWSYVGSGLIICGLAVFPGVIAGFEKCCLSQDEEAKGKRNGFLTRLVCKVFFFVLQQMNIPLAEFWLEHFVSQKFYAHLTVLMVLTFVAAQFFAIPCFYLATISQGTAAIVGEAGTDYASGLERTETSSAALFELYRYPYRYWFFVEWGYELLNFALIMVAQRFNPLIYWANFAMRLLYITAHLH